MNLFYMCSVFFACRLVLAFGALTLMPRLFTARQLAFFGGGRSVITALIVDVVGGPARRSGPRGPSGVKLGGWAAPVARSSPPCDRPRVASLLMARCGLCA